METEAQMAKVHASFLSKINDSTMKYTFSLPICNDKEMSVKCNSLWRYMLSIIKKNAP
jgi:hypothetical protein